MSAYVPRRGTVYDILDIPEVSLTARSSRGSSSYSSPNCASSSRGVSTYPDCGTPKNRGSSNTKLDATPSMFELEEDEHPQPTSATTPAMAASYAPPILSSDSTLASTSGAHLSWLAGGSTATASLSTTGQRRSAAHRPPLSNCANVSPTTTKLVAKQLSYANDALTRFSPGTTPSSGGGSYAGHSHHSWPGTTDLA